jgi:uncharacterized protein YtpQ (UPF0354 family)
MAIFSGVLSWLAPAKAKTRSFADIAEFRELVMAAARRRPAVDSVVADPGDRAKFKAVMGERSSEVDVTNLLRYLEANPHEDVGKAIERFVNSIIEVKTAIVDDSNIIAVIRSREYIDYITGTRRDIFYEPLGADLMILYMADQPDSMSVITSEDVPGKDLSTIRKIALDNGRKCIPKVVSDDSLGSGTLYYVKDNPMLSTGLIILDDFWKSIAARFPGDVLIALPRKDQLFIFDDDGNPTARTRVRRLIDATIQENFNLLSPLLYARRNGKIVVVPD